MPRTKHYMNWKDVTVVYGSGPTTITLTEITDIAVQRGEQWISFKGDGNVFATAMALADSSRSVRITGGDVGKLLTIPKNTVCTVNFKLYDAVNQSASGAGTLSFVLSNAVFLGNAPGGGQNQYIMDSIQFQAYSSDGTTDPLAVSEA